MLGDQVFRESEIWKRRDLVRWDTVPAYEQRFAYFDQLAVRPGPARTHVPLLASVALLDAYMDGVDALISTTVKRPIKNLAAVPYLTAIGAKIVGELDETYPDFGDLTSDVWRVDRSTIERFFDEPPASVVPTVHRAWRTYENYRLGSRVHFVDDLFIYFSTFVKLGSYFCTKNECFARTPINRKFGG